MTLTALTSSSPALPTPSVTRQPLSQEELVRKLRDQLEQDMAAMAADPAGWKARLDAQATPVKVKMIFKTEPTVHISAEAQRLAYPNDGETGKVTSDANSLLYEASGKQVRYDPDTAHDAMRA